jgi:wyosine [tRNA(Phe)-imidazoG37] synthetase (radical SAM superfamily)
VDLVPYKTCLYDCVYCQLGRTTRLTLERREWVPVRELLEQIKDGLRARPDHVTLGGSGEPTLHSGIGRLIAGVKAFTKVPVAVLTNGGLLWKPQVRRDLLQADLVLPSLDAGDSRMFRRVNRPHAGVSFKRMVDGLAAFRREFRGGYWLELMLLGGETAVREHAERLAAIVRRTRPDRVQINTVTRPPAMTWARPASKRELERLLPLFGPRAEIIAEFKGTRQEHEAGAGKSQVLEMLRRHPGTVKDVTLGLGIPSLQAKAYVEALLKERLLRRRLVRGTVFYQPP